MKYSKQNFIIWALIAFSLLSCSNNDQEIYQALQDLKQNRPSQEEIAKGFLDKGSTFVITKNDWGPVYFDESGNTHEIKPSSTIIVEDPTQYKDSNDFYTAVILQKNDENIYTGYMRLDSLIALESVRVTMNKAVSKLEQDERLKIQEQYQISADDLNKITSKAAKKGW